MSELIFCCPNCLAIGSSGVNMDDRSARQLARSSMQVTCEVCDEQSDIAMLDFLFSDSFSGSNLFARI